MRVVVGLLQHSQPTQQQQYVLHRSRAAATLNARTDGSGGCCLDARGAGEGRCREGAFALSMALRGWRERGRTLKATKKVSPSKHSTLVPAGVLYTGMWNPRINCVTWDLLILRQSHFMPSGGSSAASPVPHTALSPLRRPTTQQHLPDNILPLSHSNRPEWPLLRVPPRMGKTARGQP
jgi:hypothetical protein